MNVLRVRHRAVGAVTLLSCCLMLQSGAPAENSAPPAATDAVIPELRIPSGKLHGDDIYKNVRIVSVLPDGLKISHDGGVTKIAYEKLPVELRAQYKFDPGEAQQYRDKAAAEQRTAQRWVEEQNGIRSEQKRKELIRDAAQLANATDDRYAEAVRYFSAGVVDSNDWVRAAAGEVPSFIKGDAYAISGLFVRELDTGRSVIVAGLPTLKFGPSCVLVPSEDHGFAKIPSPPAESAVPLRFIGRYSNPVKLGNGNVPGFECLYMEMNNHEVYRFVPIQTDTSSSGESAAKKVPAKSDKVATVDSPIINPTDRPPVRPVLPAEKSAEETKVKKSPVSVIPSSPSPPPPQTPIPPPSTRGDDKRITNPSAEELRKIQAQKAGKDAQGKNVGQ